MCLSPEESSRGGVQPARDNFGKRTDGEYVSAELELKEMWGHRRKNNT